jgi:hypothetical protein
MSYKDENRQTIFQTDKIDRTRCNNYYIDSVGPQNASEEGEEKKEEEEEEEEKEEQEEAVELPLQPRKAKTTANL